MFNILADNIAGDPDTWPKAVAWSIIALSVAAVALGWFKWGKAQYMEAERYEDEQREQRKAAREDNP